jgi:hypothetical protein
VEAIWITIAIVAGLIVVIVVPVCAAQWARVRQAEADARMKQDLLARGLSSEEVERLSTPASVREAQIAADNQVREAQIAADLKRDLLARGLSVEEVEHLLTPQSSAESRCREEAETLASAIVKMVQGEGYLDEDAVAGLLALFLHKEATRVERLGPAPTARPMAPASQADVAPGDKTTREIHSIPAAPLDPSNRQRD